MESHHHREVHPYTVDSTNLRRNVNRQSLKRSLHSHQVERSTRATCYEHIIAHLQVRRDANFRMSRWNVRSTDADRSHIDIVRRKLALLHKHILTINFPNLTPLIKRDERTQSDFIQVHRNHQIHHLNFYRSIDISQVILVIDTTCKQ